MIKISVINASSLLTDDVVFAAVPALQKQISRDFFPAWGVDALLVPVPTGGVGPAPGSWWLTVLDDSDAAGALGYHDLTSEGLPIGKVFVRADLMAGSSWTVTASHELLEMLVDPDINLTVLIDNTLYSYEVCDACEADTYSYKIDDVLVSDFVTPAWFESFRKTGPFDFLDHIKSPLKLLPGGYIGYMDITSTKGWQQIFAEYAVDVVHSPRYRSSFPPYHSRPRVGSRRERRRVDKKDWMISLAYAQYKKEKQ